jgi:dTDP-4-amino-4,6-dideoxygalactose transaminase
MTKNELALFGGNKTIDVEFERYNSIGNEELVAAKNVIKSGNLSNFLGEWHDDFYGGIKVKELEKDCKDFFRVKHAITVNSWTSGLIAAVGAIGIEPGDEVIVSTWTMSASATAILHWNAIPVFADIDKKTYNICPKSIEKNITNQTKAIMAIDIFGQSADMNKIVKIAKKYNLKIISDTAQAPGAMYDNQFAGTLADVGGFSFNYHKHIHTGEGGVIVTNDDLIAERLRLIRNHAEAVVLEKGVEDISNMIGFNFRLGEIESAIGIEQLKKLNSKILRRQKIAERLTKGLKNLAGLKTPYIEKSCSHVFYVYALQVDSLITGIHRDKIFDALKAEGVPIGKKYGNLHLLPLFQKKIAYGKKGFPWNSEICKRNVNYDRGICPISEKLNDNEILLLGLCVNDYSDIDIDLIISAFKKVWGNFNNIKKTLL